MGNPQSTSVIPISNSNSSPCLYYLCRRLSYVLYLTQTRTQQYRFNAKPKFYPDSALCYVSDTLLMLVGGTNSKGKLKSNCFMVDFEQMTVTKISPIPIPCKLGNLIQYQDFVYLVGGLIENQDEKEISSEYIGSPVMRHNKISGSWEVFIDQEILISKDRNNISKTHAGKEKFYLKFLLYPGSFLINSKIYYFGGTVVYPEIHSNFSVYSMDLGTSNLQMVIEPYTFPIPLNSPLASANSKFALICGGEGISYLPNKSCHVFTAKKGFSSVKGKELEITENYPPRCTEDYVIIMAFPKFALKLRNSEGWLTYSVSSKIENPAPILFHGSKSVDKASPIVQSNGSSVTHSRGERFSSSFSNLKSKTSVPLRPTALLTNFKQKSK